MKRFSIHFFALCLALLSSCGKIGVDNGDDGKILSISNDKIEVLYQGTATLNITGVEPAECKITVDDDYFVDVSQLTGAVSITGKKVGEVLLTVTYKNQTKTCSITVVPTVNYVGIPITKFGESKDKIKSLEANTLLMDNETRLQYHMDKIFGDMPLDHFYNFTSDLKLSYIVTSIGYSQPNFTSYSAMCEKVKPSLDQRYSFVEEMRCVKTSNKMLIYTFKNQFYIGARVENFGGWAIAYAPTKEKLVEILDVHSSLRIL